MRFVSPRRVTSHGLCCGLEKRGWGAQAELGSDLPAVGFFFGSPGCSPQTSVVHLVFVQVGDQNNMSFHRANSRRNRGANLPKRECRIAGQWSIPQRGRCLTQLDHEIDGNSHGTLGQMRWSTVESWRLLGRMVRNSLGLTGRCMQRNAGGARGRPVQLERL